MRGAAKSSESSMLSRSSARLLLEFTWIVNSIARWLTRGQNVMEDLIGLSLSSLPLCQERVCIYVCMVCLGRFFLGQLP